MNANENLLKAQLEESKQRSKIYKKEILNMIRLSLQKCPKDILIEVLLKRKIIQKDWLQKGNKYILKENVNK